MVTVFVVRLDAAGRSYEFLQLLRAKDDYMGGTWQIVRGGVHEGETYIQAALREMREESGLVPREFYHLGTVESFYTEVDDTIWHSVPFCAIVDRKQVAKVNEEHEAIRWVPGDDMDSETMWQSERQLLDGLIRDILDDDSAAKPFLRVKV